MNNVIFSIIVPTFNRSNSIVETINSVLKQDYKNYELIIIDDGSTDDTELKVGSIIDSRIIYHKIINSERGVARNVGIDLSKGEYITFLDSDDLFLENHLSNALEQINKHPELQWFHLTYRIKSGTKVYSPDYPEQHVEKKLMTSNYLSCHGVFLKRTIAITNKFNTNRVLAGLEDWELWIRIALQHKLKIFKSDTVLLINHDKRSVITESAERLIAKIILFQENILHHTDFLKIYPNLKGKFIASTFSYLALHLALTKKNRFKTIKFTFLAMLNYPLFIFQKRFLVIVKHFFKWA